MDNGGKLEGTIEGNQPPKITTTSLSEGTVNQLYTATLQATGNGITWSLDSGSTLPNGLKLERSTISGTPTAAGTSTFTVKAETTRGSDSKEYTLTIQSANGSCHRREAEHGNSGAVHQQHRDPDRHGAAGQRHQQKCDLEQ